MMKTTAVGVVGGVMLGLATAGTAMAGSIGELVFQGDVRVAQAGSETLVRVSDTRYAWFSGDRVVTRNGHGMLELDQGASIGFTQDTDASLTLEGQTIQVDLQAGSLLYVVPQAGPQLTVNSGHYIFSTASDGEMVRVSANEGGSLGVIQRTADGALKVSVHEGMITARGTSGQVYYKVAAGEQIGFSAQEPGLVNLQLGAGAGAGASAGAGEAGVGGFLAANAPALLTFGVIAVAGAVIVLSSDDPVSP